MIKKSTLEIVFFFPLSQTNLINASLLGNAAFKGSHIHKELKRDGFVKQTEANRFLGWGMTSVLVNIRFESCLFPSAEFDCRESSRLSHSLPLSTQCVALTGVSQSGNTTYTTMQESLETQVTHGFTSHSTC